MNKDQVKVMRLLAKIQNECCKINFNTKFEAFFSFRKNWFEVSCSNFSTCFHLGCRESLKTDKIIYRINLLEKVLTELKEFYKMNRIIKEKGES